MIPSTLLPFGFLEISWQEWAVATVLILTVLIVFDDLIIDLYALLRGVGPKRLSEDELLKLKHSQQKRIAIIVANWREEDVIARMVAGNLRSIEYRHFDFFLGVYPNDEATLKQANLVAGAHANVHVVVNTLDGPTTKGQLINQIVREILRHERRVESEFDVFLMHDSEDILHPLSLQVINREIGVPLKEWVGATYIDEFAEVHTKDLFVRQAWGAPIPSAGVGTALRRNLVLSLLAEQNGDLLRDDCLTEDYVLGLTAGQRGFQTRFVNFFREIDGRRDFVATREYFPKRFMASVRQKTRWMIGIGLQGSQILGWGGRTGQGARLAHRYFLYRDRRGALNAIAALGCTILLIWLVTLWLLGQPWPAFTESDWFRLGSLVATVGMFNRLFHRVRAVALVNGGRHLIFVVLRWPLSNLIFGFATARAYWQFYRSRWTGVPLRWSKTQHELPADFGIEGSSNEPANSAQSKRDGKHG
jgi:adsorption protein B